ncbi:ESCRT-0 subunit protein hse1 [Dispira simplex]|nr:ESCRT-0 subunit protein hse1 [Dispira simplex]
MFRTANPFEAQVAKATGEDLVTENWELFMNICDRIGRSETNARDCMAAIQKRMLHRNANVVLYTLSLTDALAKNCGKTAQREISSRAFTSTLVRVLNDKSVHEVVKKHTLEYIQQWAFEFRSDPDLGLMEEVYHELQAQNFQFPSPQKPEKVPAKKELQRQKEEDELQLAIALSLSENEAQKQQHSSTIQKPPVASTSQAKATVSTYPSPSSIAVPHGVQQGNQRGPAARVKALFDFQATEPGELGFFKGDIIDVLDQKYKDWWKGRLRTQTGIFPANYVQLIREPSPSDLSKEYETETRVLNSAQQVDQLLQLLDTIDPRVGNISENEPLQSLYHDVLTLRPMLIQLIEKYTQKRDEMIALNEKFNRTVQMYDSLLSTNTGQYGQPGE